MLALVETLNFQQKLNINITPSQQTFWRKCKTRSHGFAIRAHKVDRQSGIHNKKSKQVGHDNWNGHGLQIRAFKLRDLFAYPVIKFLLFFPFG
jgi:hypothetical protein